MKKLAFLLGLGLALSCRSGDRFQVGDPLPSLHMILSDGSPFRTDQLAPGRYTVIMIFRTDCIHCLHETADILKAEPSSLQDLNFIFITAKSQKDLKRYADSFRLADYPNIRAGTDRGLEFMRYFKPAAVPYVVIYDRSKHLYRIYDGPVPVDSLSILTKSL